ncbi:MAG: efflux RND transporter periplasmic adaptor subunit [Phenylobacterium sp.]|uniref:efflux RND transporter periplasmic adaptor subunit n=1 Tax=Phenylobacterium sp. TaxID=1871053 RepID=UPI00391BFC8F
MAGRRRRWLVFGGAGVLAVAALAWLFLPRPVTVEVARIGRGPIAERVEDQGKARVREAYLVSAPVSGRLARIEHHVGDRMVAGRTLVARIEPLPADLQDPRTRGQAEAAVSAAAAAVEASRAYAEQTGAELRRAESDLRRLQALTERGFASAQALEAAETSARTARAASEAARADVALRRAELAAARAALTGPEARGGTTVEVLAPVSGYVTRIIEPSERTVAMGEPLLEIADAGGLEAAIEFLSQDAVRIREGMAAEIYDWGGPGTLTAQVRRVEPLGFTKVSALGVEEQRVLVLLQFTDPPAKWAQLAPGYRVWGRVFLRQAPDAVKAPLGALARADGGWAVFRVEGGKARLRRISVGAITDRDAEVLEGLAPGDVVVVFPSDKVRDGVTVRAAR